MYAGNLESFVWFWRAKLELKECGHGLKFEVVKTSLIYNFS